MEFFDVWICIVKSKKGVSISKNKSQLFSNLACHGRLPCRFNIFCWEIVKPHMNFTNCCPNTTDAFWIWTVVACVWFHESGNIQMSKSQTPILKQSQIPALYKSKNQQTLKLKVPNIQQIQKHPKFQQSTNSKHWKFDFQPYLGGQGQICKNWTVIFVETLDFWICSNP